MKSKEGKEKWRNFMKAYEKTVDDFNFGTMLRKKPKVRVWGEGDHLRGKDAVLRH